MDFQDPIQILRNNININCLTDDSLVYIFKYLSIQEKLKIQTVCKKWFNLSNLSWSNIKILKLEWFFLYENKLTKTSEHGVSKFCDKILKKCGAYIEELHISHSLKAEFPILFISISKYCKNIRYLILTDTSNEMNLVFDDNLLELLFTSNVNINRIFFNHLTIMGYSLLNLNMEKMEEIEIIMCKIQTGYFYGFLSHLKNLKKITMHINNPTLMIQSFNAIFMSKCESILEMNISGMRADDLKRFLSRQKNLCKLNTMDIKINKELIFSLPKDSLQNMTCNYSRKISDSLFYLKNLTNLKCVIDQFHDECVTGLIKCSNLKVLSLEIKDYCLTPYGESNFSKFTNIESLHLLLHQNVDNILIALSNCKVLKYLSLEECLVTIMGLMGMSYTSNLIYFAIDSLKEYLVDEELVIVIVKLKFLKKIRLAYANVNAEFFKLAKDVKEQRGDKHALEVECLEVNGGESIEYNNEWPLIKLNYVFK